MKMSYSKIGFAVAVSIGMASSAMAQMNPIILAGPQNFAMGRVMALRSKQIQSQFDPSSTTKSTGLAPGSQDSSSQALSIPSDIAVSRHVHDLYIGALVQSGGQAEAIEVDRRLGNIRATFARLIAPYGLRADVLDDVMAAHMIVMWMAVNQQTAPPTPTQAQAVRRQMRNVFASSSGAISAAADRQSAAEYVMYETCMTVLTRSQLASRPDLDKRIADAVNATMSAQGYSLRGLQLTDQGLIRGNIRDSQD